MEKLKNVPVLRFPEFSGEWNETQLGKIAKFTKGKGISKADISEDGKLECIRYGELYTHYGEVIDKIKSRTNIEASNLVLSEANDVIIPASGETQIDISTASCVLKAGVGLGGDLNIIKTKNNGVFLSYYLNNKKKMDIANLAQGISVVHLYSSQLALLNLNLPQIVEQQKIAALLTSVENKLQSLKKKKILLKQYKKGVMQKIFSQELRFKDDNGKEFPKWVIKNLDEVCISIVSGKTKPELEGEYSVYGSTGVIGKSTDFTHNGKYLLVARVGANAGTINIVNGKICVTDNTLIISTNNTVNMNFVFYFLLENNLNKLVFGSGQPLITGGQLKLLKINIPCLEEQTKIANFLSSIDEKINLCNTQIEKTEQYKKGLLQKMFV